MILEDEKRKYLQILNRLNEVNAKSCTQKELASYLGVSTRTIHSFVNGESFNFWLLCRYADFLGEGIEFNLI